MRKSQSLANQRASIQESWTEDERRRRRQLADYKLVKLCHLLATPADTSGQGQKAVKNPQVATAC